MESKITLGRLTAMLAIATGKQKRLCEDFVKELFQIVATELEQGESIRIKGFGSFRLVEVETRKSVNVATGEENRIPGYRKVTFTPSKELASIVNGPFEDFSTVEIADDLATDELMMEDIDLPDEDEQEFPASEEDIESVEEEIVDDETSEAYTDKVISESKESQTPDETLVSNNKQETEEVIVPEYYYEDEEESKKGKVRFVWGMVAGFLLACVVAGGMFIMWGDSLFGISISKGSESQKVETEEDLATADEIPLDSFVVKIEKDSIESSELKSAKPNVDTAPSDTPKYDTVSTTRYLTTMARDHYGNFNLWPVIYEENKDILGHPDRIRPGTKVRIPSLSKYGVNPSDPEDVARIKRKGVEIYSHYKK